MLLTHENIKEYLLSDIKNNNLDLDDYDLFYLVDSYLPVYNSDIIENWKNMPSEYDDRGMLEYGHDCNNLSIVKLMQFDLTIYLYDLINDIMEEIKSELEE